MKFFFLNRSVRLEELNVVRVLHALTYEEIEEKGHTAQPTNLEGVSAKTIVLNENKDTETEIEIYLNEDNYIKHVIGHITTKNVMPKN